MADNKPQAEHVEGNDGPLSPGSIPAEEEKSEVLIDAEVLDKQVAFIPRPEDQIDDLGIPEWRTLERKLVRRLDMTLMVSFDEYNPSQF